LHAWQEGSACNGRFEPVCYHPLWLFSRHGDGLAEKPWPGNVHGAEDRDEVLLPQIERQNAAGKPVTFRPDAAFAKPRIYEALEGRRVNYALRAPAKTTWGGMSAQSEKILSEQSRKIPLKAECLRGG
jgi:hypothetical protein